MAAHRSQFLPYPQQRGAVSAIVQEAARQGRAELMQMWSGQGVRLLRATPAGELVSALVRQADAVWLRLDESRRP